MKGEEAFGVIAVVIQFIINGNGQQQPTISYVSQSKTVNVGDTVDLDCSVQYAYNYPVLWVKVSESESFQE